VKRILMVLTVGALLVAAMIVTAVPAFAVNCEANPDHPNCVLVGPGNSENTSAAGGGNPNIEEDFQPGTPGRGR
jgi:hypothetical protein